MKFFKRLAHISAATVIAITLLVVSATPQAAAQIRVACVGDSITAGVAVSSSSKTYPSDLQAALGSGYNVQNFGVSGTALMNLPQGNPSSHPPYTSTSAYNNMIAFNPNIVIVMLGTNDSAFPVDSNGWASDYLSTYISQYESFITTLRNQPAKPTVYIATTPIVAGTNQYAIDPIVANTIITPAIHTISAATGAPLIDVHTATASTGADYADNVHPNDLGTSFIAYAAYTALKPALSTGQNYQIINAISGMCVTASSGSSGAALQQAPCGGAQTNQQWTLTTTGNGSFAVHSVATSSLAWDDPGASTTAGTLMQVQTASNTTDQEWLAMLLPSNDWTVTNLASGQCMDDTNASTTSGTQFQQYNCSQNTNQQFNLVPVVTGGLIPPAAPSNLTGTSTSTTQVDLTWVASATSGVTYTIYRSAISGFTPSSSNQLASGIGGTTYSDTGLGSDTTYYYVLEAVNANGASTPTNQLGITTAICECGPGNISPASDYTIVNQASGSCVDETSGSSANGTTVQQWACQSGNQNQEWKFTPTSNGYYKVNPYNSTTAAWDVVNIGTSPGTGMQLWSYSGGKNEQFKPMKQSSGYYLFVDLNSGLCLGFPNSNNGQQLQINSCNGSSNENFTLNQVGGTVPTAPAAPTNLTATAASSSQINLTWMASTTSGVTYSVVRGGTIVSSGLTGTTYSDMGLVADTAYSYVVNAVNPTGATASNTASATTLVTTVSAPVAPTNLTATAASSSQINLSWTASTTGGVTYSVLRGGTTVASGLTRTTYIDSGLTSDTSYSYVVEAVNAAGTAISNTASTMTQIVTPSGISTTVNYTIVNQSTGTCVDETAGSNANGTVVQQWACQAGNTNQQWKFTATSNGYYELTPQNSTTAAWNVVNVGTSPGTGIQLWAYSGGKNEQFFPTQQSNGDYTFTDLNSGLCLNLPNTNNGQQLQINTCNGSTSENFALNQVGGPPPPPGAPAPPTGVIATAASTSQINLIWTASTTSGVTYSVFRSTTSGFTPSISNQLASGITGTTYSDVGVAASTTYYYIVQAVNLSGTTNSSQASATTTGSGEGAYGGTAAVIPGTVMASNYDTGGQGIGYNVTSTNGSANSYRSDGVDLETSSSPATGNDMGWTSGGQWFRYTVNVTKAGTYTVNVLVTAPSAVSDALHISNSSGTNLTGSVNIPATGGWQNWQSVTATVTLPAGVQTLTINQDNGGWNIDSFAFGAPNIYVQEATDGVQQLQSWYVQSSGLYQSPTGWWNTANAMTVLVDYSRATNTTQYLSAVANTFANANSANGSTNFITSANDDEGWWALAWMDAYDLTNNAAYLSMAQTIFTDMTGQWDTGTCGGGVWWSKDLTNSAYKNAITNELFLELAAGLANRTSNATQKALYLSWAQKEWQWFNASGMINSQNLVNDGMNATNPSACTNNGQPTWTYNQGVILAGLVELYNADQDSTLLPKAQAIANAAMANLVTSSGILHEPSLSGPDGPQFKGIFIRDLYKLSTAVSNPQYKMFVDNNAKSIWSNDQGPNYQFGGLWEGPFDSGDGTRQSSAVDTFNAAMLMQYPTGPVGYYYCGPENATCAFAGTAKVAFGANGSYTYGTYTNSTSCNTSVFSPDPNPSVPEACFYQITSASSAPTGPVGYTFCAAANATCSFSGTAGVAFGANGSFVYGNFTNGTLCSPSSFSSDPNPGVPESCFYLVPSGVTSTCDIYASGGTPCVAAHSTVRALFGSYSGRLYQVQRASDGSTTDISTMPSSVYANAATQNSFCSGTSCIISKIYDQSSYHNDLAIEGPGGAAPTPDSGASATALPITIHGNQAYGVSVTYAVGYRNNATTGVAKGASPEGMYMVTSGTNVNNACCFDYGNAEESSTDTGNGHMDAINFGTACIFGPCSGSGPWVEADLENGQYMGNGSNLGNVSMTSAFVTAMLKNNGQNTFALKGGNAQSGGLTTDYSGTLPTINPGYIPMNLEGAVVLGTGGDNSDNGVGSFFEGAMTSGYPTDATENAVQANITAAGYAGSSGAGYPDLGGGSYTGPSDPNGSGPQDGFASPAVEEPNDLMGSKPAFASFNGSLYLAFQGLNVANSLFVTSSTSGTGFPSATEYSNIQTGSAPAMAVFNSKLYVAFQGLNVYNDLYVTSSSSGSGFPTATQYSNIQMGCAPAMAVFNSQLYLSFQANDAGHTLHLTSSSDGTTWPNAWQVANVQVGSAPAMAVFNGKLYVAFRANDPSNNLWIASSSDGVNFSSQSISGQSMGGNSSPTLAVANGILYYIYGADDTGNEMMVTASTDGTTWQGPAAYPNNHMGATGPSAQAFGAGVSVGFQSNDTRDVLFMTQK